MIGTRLAHYEVTARLGAGGMGEVYPVVDMKLGRGVPIKVLPAAFVSHQWIALSYRVRAGFLVNQVNHELCFVASAQGNGRNHLRERTRVTEGKEYGRDC